MKYVQYFSCLLKSVLSSHVGGGTLCSFFRDICVKTATLYWDKTYDSFPKGLIKMQTEDDEITLMQFYFIFLFSDLCSIDRYRQGNMFFSSYIMRSAHALYIISCHVKDWLVKNPVLSGPTEHLPQCLSRHISPLLFPLMNNTLPTFSLTFSQLFSACAVRETGKNIFLD